MTTLDAARAFHRHALTVANGFDSFAFDPNNYTKTQRGTYVSKGGRAMSAGQFEAATRRYQAAASRPKGQSPVPPRIPDHRIRRAVPEDVFGRYQQGEIPRRKVLAQARKSPAYATPRKELPLLPPTKGLPLTQAVSKMTTPTRPEVQQAATGAIPGVVKAAGLTGETGRAVQAKLTEAVQASGRGGIGGAVQGLASWLKSLPRAAGRLALRGLQAIGRRAMANLGDFAKVFTGAGGMAAGGYAGMKLGTAFGPLGMMLGTAGGAAAGALAGTGNFGGLRRLLTLRGAVPAVMGAGAGLAKRAGRFGWNAAKLMVNTPYLKDIPQPTQPGTGSWPKRFAKAGLWMLGTVATTAALIAAPFLTPGIPFGLQALGGAGIALGSVVRGGLQRRMGVITPAILQGQIRLSESGWDAFAGWGDWKQVGDRMVSPSGKRKLTLEVFQRLSTARAGGAPAAATGKAVSAPAKTPSKRTPASKAPASPTSFGADALAARINAAVTGVGGMSSLEDLKSGMTKDQKAHVDKVLLGLRDADKLMLITDRDPEAFTPEQLENAIRDPRSGKLYGIVGAIAPKQGVTADDVRPFVPKAAAAKGSPLKPTAPPPTPPNPEQVALRKQYERGVISARELAARTKAAGAKAVAAPPPAEPVRMPTPFKGPRIQEREAVTQEALRIKAAGGGGADSLAQRLQKMPLADVAHVVKKLDGGVYPGNTRSQLVERAVKLAKGATDHIPSIPPAEQPLPPDKAKALAEHEKTAVLLSVALRRRSGLPPDPKLMKQAADLGLKVAHLLDIEPATKTVLGTVKDATVRAAAYVAAKLGAGARWLDQSLMPKVVGGLAAAGTAAATVPLGVGGGLALMIGSFATKADNPVIWLLGGFDWMDGVEDAGAKAVRWGVRTPGRVYAGVRDGLRSMAESPPDPKLADLKAALDAVRKVSPLPPFTDAQLTQILAAVQQAAGGAAARTFPGK
jgi:hypothetical protein